MAVQHKVTMPVIMRGFIGQRDEYETHPYEEAEISLGSDSSVQIRFPGTEQRSVSFHDQGL